MIFKLFSKADTSGTLYLAPKMGWVFHLFMTNIILCLLIMLAVSSCRQAVSDFKSFDPARWKSERITCTSYRNSVIKAMEDEFELFLGMNETQLTEVLGTPDATQLYTRGQKFFNYSLACDSTETNFGKLRIRFSALDQVNEVLVLD